jgi:hypothetical protein
VYGVNIGSGHQGILGASDAGVVGTDPCSGNSGKLGTSTYGVYGYSSSNWAGYFEGKGYFSGNVGIGTDGPAVKLHVHRTGAPQLRLSSGASESVDFYKGGSGLAVSINGSETVRFANNGNVGIGTGSPSYTLAVDGNTGISSDLTVSGQVYVPNMSSTATSYKTVVYNESTDQLYYYDLVSSARYKEDIEPLQDDFSKVLQGECKSFVYKANGEKGIGFIAEEFDALGLSNLVTYKDGEPDGIKYDMVPLYLLEVLKDQGIVIEEQAKTTEQLKAENESLTERVEALERTVQQLAKMKEVQL